MQLFKDRELKESIDINSIDLGSVQAGEHKVFEFWLHNDTDAEIRNLSYEMHVVKEVIEGRERDYSKNIEEFTITQFPKILKTLESKLFEFSWSPKVDIKRGLKLEISIHGQEYYS
jgi:hypothetical protein